MYRKLFSKKKVYKILQIGSIRMLLEYLSLSLEISKCRFPTIASVKLIHFIPMYGSLITSFICITYII